MNYKELSKVLDSSTSKLDTLLGKINKVINSHGVKFTEGDTAPTILDDGVYFRLSFLNGTHSWEEWKTLDLALRDLEREEDFWSDGGMNGDAIEYYAYFDDATEDEEE